MTDISSEAAPQVEEYSSEIPHKHLPATRYTTPGGYAVGIDGVQHKQALITGMKTGVKIRWSA